MNHHLAGMLAFSYGSLLVFYEISTSKMKLLFKKQLHHFFLNFCLKSSTCYITKKYEVVNVLYVLLP